jgi:Zn finger protein HypA/HybF involved in hydrogenase expression
MHEMTRVRELIRLLREKGVHGKVRIRLGHLEATQIMLEEVKECFEIAVKDTDLEGSEITFVPRPIRMKCRNCDMRFEISFNDFLLKCPHCEEGDCQLLEDDELRVLAVDTL